MRVGVRNPTGEAFYFLLLLMFCVFLLFFVCFHFFTKPSRQALLAPDLLPGPDLLPLVAVSLGPAAFLVSLRRCLCQIPTPSFSAAPKDKHILF